MSTVWPQFCLALKQHRGRLYRARRADAIRAYRQQHATAIAATKKRYRAAHRAEVAAANKRYRQRNAESVRAQKAEYRKRNAAHISQHDSAYKRQNRAHINALKRQRTSTDATYRMVNNLRRRLGNAMRGHSKSASTLALLGCTPEECFRHLERQFKDGMSWDNRREWHIDHIRPIASFDLSLEAEQRRCFHYSNLQPLWAAENLRKGAKLGWRSSRPATSAKPGTSSTSRRAPTTSPAPSRPAGRRTRSMS